MPVSVSSKRLRKQITESRTRKSQTTKTESCFRVSVCKALFVGLKMFERKQISKNLYYLSYAKSIFTALFFKLHLEISQLKKNRRLITKTVIDNLLIKLNFTTILPARTFTSLL